MPGYDTNRFIDLSESVAKHLICSICLNIYDNAVRSECEHTFCKSCVQQWIEDNHKECPECREEFATRKRSNDKRNENNLVMIGSHVFRAHLLVNSMISELTIKCDYNFNGCQQSIKLYLLSSHVKQCEHRFCQKCDFPLGEVEEHNCFELTRNDRNHLKVICEKETEIKRQLFDENRELKTKLQTNEENFNKLNEKYKNLLNNSNKLSEDHLGIETKLESNEHKINELIQKYENCLEKTRRRNGFTSNQNNNNTIRRAVPSEDTNNNSFVSQQMQYYLSGILSLKQIIRSFIKRIQIGSFKTCSDEFVLDHRYIRFKNVLSNRENASKGSINLSYNNVLEMLYCRDDSFSAIIFKTNEDFCHSIRVNLYLGDNSPNEHKFDIKSKDRKHRYIIVTFSPKKNFFNNCIEFLSLVEPKIKIREKSFDEINEMFD